MNGSIDLATRNRAQELFRQDCERTWRHTDSLLLALLIVQWPASIAAALLFSPRAWEGEVSSVHVHVWAAAVIGGLLTLFPAALARLMPGAAITRHVLAAAQVLYSALLIHLTGGRIETHFHVFGSLAFIAFYRDWRVLASATAIVALDHAIRGMWWPRSVFGFYSPQSWRWLEHAGWVVFEDIVLMLSIHRGLREAHERALGGARLEASKEAVERQVTERTAQLEKAREDAEAANRAKTEFLANMSHEIRTPMTAIVGFADLLVDPSITNEDRAEHVKTIRRNGEHLVSVINDILDLSKIEVGRMTLSDEPCRICQVVAEVAALMRVRARGKGLSLDVEYQFPVPEVIRADPLRVRQILVNLVGNAVKFTDAGGVRVIVRSDDPKRTSPCIHITVHDTGIGMSKPDLDRLFQPFSQVDASQTRRFSGTGLGLAISRRFARMLGGDISVDSAPGDGSAFTLRIPMGDVSGVRLIANATEAVASADVEAAGPAPKLRGRILLAEDGPDNQRLIAFHLKRAGAEVEIVENGRQALDAAMRAAEAGSPYGLILMDMQMPEMDGYSATRELRARGCPTPIVALTAHAMSGDREKCIKAGCDDYESKPISPSRLLHTAARYLQRDVAGERAASAA